MMTTIYWRICTIKYSYYILWFIYILY